MALSRLQLKSPSKRLPSSALDNRISCCTHYPAASLHNLYSPLPSHHHPRPSPLVTGHSGKVKVEQVGIRLYNKSKEDTRHSIMRAAAPFPCEKTSFPNFSSFQRLSPWAAAPPTDSIRINSFTSSKRHSRQQLQQMQQMQFR